MDVQPKEPTDFDPGRTTIVALANAPEGELLWIWDWIAEQRARRLARAEDADRVARHVAESTLGARTVVSEAHAAWSRANL